MKTAPLSTEGVAAIVTMARRNKARGGFLMDCEEAMPVLADQRDAAVGQLAMERVTKPRELAKESGGK